jgi:RND family efflux transporter MFP subunit
MACIVPPSELANRTIADLLGVGFSLAVVFPWILISGCSAPSEAQQLPTPKVTVERSQQRELVDHDEYNGWAEASATVDVRSRVRGHVVAVKFVDGSFVDVDQPLFELDPRPFQAELDRASEQVKIAQAQQYAAERDELRVRDLLTRNAATQSEVEKFEAVRKTWDAQVAAGKEEVRRRNLELAYATIKAPISGKIGKAMITEGNLVNAGGSDPVMTTIVATDPIYVTFSVDEPALLRYRERRKNAAGEPEKLPQLEDVPIPFEFALASDQGFPNQGMLDFADNRLDPTTGTIQVRGRVKNPDGRFIPGSRVRVRVAVSKPYQGMLVPDTAILSDLDQRYVLVLNENNIVTRKNIRPGKLLGDGMRVVLSGRDDSDLRADEWVIVEGLQRARINDAVEPFGRDGKPLSKGGN